MADEDDSNEQPDLLLEKPPSPVLSNKTTRRFLLSRKIQRKSRVKLTDRFCEGTSQCSTDSETVEADRTLRTTEDTFDIAETIEDEDKTFGESSDQKHNLEDNDFDFKKPELPIISTKNGKGQPLKTSELGGFKTAAGSSIHLSDDVVKKSKKLFDDILIPSSPNGETRCNKYAFISKDKTDRSIHKSGLCNEKEKSISENKGNVSENVNVGDRFSNETSGKKLCSFGFKTSGKSLQIKESAYITACKRFGEDFDVRKPLLEKSAVTNVPNYNDQNLLSTQETNELLSDFTIVEEKLRNNKFSPINEEQDNFKGFEAESINQSRRNAKEFKKVVFKYIMAIEVCSKKIIPQNILTNTTTSSPDRGNQLHGQDLGFTTALGNQIHISSSAMKNALQNFKETKIENTNKTSFSMASGKKIQISASALNAAESKFRLELENSEKTFFEQETNSYQTKSFRTQDTEDSGKTSIGFSKASGKKIQLNKSALVIARTKFQREFEVCQENTIDTVTKENQFNLKKEDRVCPSVVPEQGFNGFDGKTIKESLNKLNAFFKSFQGFSNNDQTLVPSFSNISPLQELGNDTLKPRTCGFSTASGNKLIPSNDALEKAKRMLEIGIATSPMAKKIEDENTKPCSLFQSATGNSLKISEDALSKAKHLFNDVDNISFDSCSGSVSNISLEESNTSLNQKTALNKSTKVYRRKRLGVSGCRPILIAPHKIEQAMKLFENERSTIMSPIKQNFPVIYNSTPLKNGGFPEVNADITPIKSINSKIVPEKLERKEAIVDDRFSIQECTKGSIDSWNKNLEDEKLYLEMKLKLIEDQQKALFFQKCCLESKSQAQQKRRNGILFDKKQASDRVSLAKFLKLDTGLRKKLDINPQNAELVHFRCTRQNATLVTTLDGAKIIPNINRYIGLSEIEVAFQVLPGVDPTLIPKGWIGNHFKWIIWKLASYENFSTNLKDCLTVENVIQQLKYRYDREIDRAERSTLRKIYEMDDVPQKRMVLCVSNIFRLQGEQFELELTDGWYSIRTVIDKPISRQVIGGKIQIGTKLITCGAELVNCEGCHPLQATDMVRLKINCNSTRRTRWYAKLGYQKCPEPFPLKVCSVYPDGGIIGSIKIFIARVYPVKYVEKQNRLSVWRNTRAEELRAQDWENKGRQDMEKLRETITRDYEKNMCNTKQNLKLNISDADIQKITSPQTLFTFCQNHNDPERLQEVLTSSQKVSVMDYQQRFLHEEQQEISRKLKDTIGHQEIPKRDVTPVLQVLVIDILDSIENKYVFQIWRPSDMHLEIIKESTIFKVYNVLPRKNGGLCTINRTKFQTEQMDLWQFNKYKRTVHPISQLSESVNKPLFNEFDTVGIVVTMSIHDFSQSLWLSDPSGRLLFVKIFESSKNCLLLDKLKVGQLVAASNLIFCEPKSAFGEAVANHLTVFASYPQAKHLQEGINTLIEQLPQDMNLFLEKCNKTISYYIDKTDITKDQKKMSSALVQSNSSIASDIFDESSNVLFSMIDVDQYR